MIYFNDDWCSPSLIMTIISAWMWLLTFIYLDDRIDRLESKVRPSVEEMEIIGEWHTESSDEEEDELIQQIRERTPTHPPWQDMTHKLINVTQDIAGALNSASDISVAKKQELATLLRSIPEFIDRVTNPGSVEENPIPVNSTPTDRDFLVATLDNLRSQTVADS